MSDQPLSTIATHMLDAALNRRLQPLRWNIDGSTLRLLEREYQYMAVISPSAQQTFLGLPIILVDTIGITLVVKVQQ